jgi:hypothetical protein
MTNKKSEEQGKQSTQPTVEVKDIEVDKAKLDPAYNFDINQEQKGSTRPFSTEKTRHPRAARGL